MALPKKLDEINEKLDLILAIVGGHPEGTPPADSEQVLRPDIDPAALLAESIDYDTYDAKEVIARVASLSTEQRTLLHGYEIARKNRATVLKALSADG